MHSTTGTRQRYTPEDGQALMDRIADDGADHFTGREDTRREALITRGPWRDLIFTSRVTTGKVHPQETVTRAMTHADSVHFRSFLQARAEFSKQWSLARSGDRKAQERIDGADAMESLGRAGRTIAAEAALDGNPALAGEAMDLMAQAGEAAHGIYSGQIPPLPPASMKGWPATPEEAAAHGGKLYHQADTEAACFAKKGSRLHELTQRHLVQEALAQQAKAMYTATTNRIQALPYREPGTAEAHDEILEWALDTEREDGAAAAYRRAGTSEESTKESYRTLEALRGELLALALAALLMPVRLPPEPTVRWARDEAAACQMMTGDPPDKSNGQVNRIMIHRALANAGVLLRVTEGLDAHQALGEYATAVAHQMFAQWRGTDRISNEARTEIARGDARWKPLAEEPF